MNYNKISIITPSYNQAQFLEETILSVLNQDYPNLEYMIIDGGSTDNSVDIIKKYNDSLTYWISEKDRGQTHAVNKGLERATGDIIGWINSDDVYLNHCFFEAIKYFADNPSVDIVFSDYYYVDENGDYIKARKEIPFNYNVYLWTRNCYHANCAGFFRRRVFEKAGKLDESLNYGMDYEYYMRCAKAGIKFSHYRGYWGAYRLHGQSKSIGSHNLQLLDANIIFDRFCQENISPLGKRARNLYYKLYRIGLKIFIGSYFLKLVNQNNPMIKSNNSFSPK